MNKAATRVRNMISIYAINDIASDLGAVPNNCILSFPRKYHILFLNKGGDISVYLNNIAIINYDYICNTTVVCFNVEQLLYILRCIIQPINAKKSEYWFIQNV